MIVLNAHLRLVTIPICLRQRSQWEAFKIKILTEVNSCTLICNSSSSSLTGIARSVEYEELDEATNWVRFASAVYAVMPFTEER